LISVFVDDPEEDDQREISLNLFMSEVSWHAFIIEGWKIIVELLKIYGKCYMFNKLFQ